MVERIKQNADKTLHYLGQPSYFQKLSLPYRLINKHTVCRALKLTN
jgi:hypothetical protein